MSANAVWTKVTAFFSEEPEEWSAWIDVFERHGVNGTVQTDDPPTLGAYLAPGSEDGLSGLRDELLSRGVAKVETELVEEQDWAESWKQFFKPVRIGAHTVVRPTWEPFECSPGDIEIVLDPGQAFGTGDHPTTRMCLELIESVMDRKTPEAADIGCGSGILAVAMMKQGATSVVCVDTDPVSVESTLSNAERNGVVVEAFVGKGFEPLPQSATFDLVVSNIISAALIVMAPVASQRVRAGGIWLVSGIIEANWPDVLHKAQTVGFELIEMRQEGEWVAATFRR